MSKEVENEIINYVNNTVEKLKLLGYKAVRKGGKVEVILNTANKTVEYNEIKKLFSNDYTLNGGRYGKSFYDYKNKTWCEGVVILTLVTNSATKKVLMRNVLLKQLI